MSGTGKSAALAELERRGHRVVDTDYGDWIEDVRLPDGSVEPLWNEERIDELLYRAFRRRVVRRGHRGQPG